MKYIRFFYYRISNIGGFLMNTKQTDCTPINLELIEQVRPNMPEQAVLYSLSDFFKVMGDGTRIQILWALDESEMCVADLSVLLNMTKSAVSHQLSALRAASLIRSRREGKQVFYALNDEHVKMVLETALEHIQEGSFAHITSAAEAVHSKLPDNPDCNPLPPAESIYRR